MQFRSAFSQHKHKIAYGSVNNFCSGQTVPSTTFVAGKYDDHLLGEHVALLFYDNRAASVDVLVGMGVGEGMGEGRKKKNISRPTLNLQPFSMGGRYLGLQNGGNFSHLSESERCESFLRFHNLSTKQKNIH